MFISLFAPYLLHAQEVSVTPPAFVQMAAASSGTPDMVFDGGCEVVQTSDKPTDWDTGGFFPAQLIGYYYSSVLHYKLDDSKATVSILQGPKHGKLAQVSAENAKKEGIGPESGPLYSYRPNTGYLGPDDATLLIELDGKRYKSHVDFYVVNQVNDNDWYEEGTPATRCAQSQPTRIAAAML